MDRPNKDLEELLVMRGRRLRGLVEGKGKEETEGRSARMGEIMGAQAVAQWLLGGEGD